MADSQSLKERVKKLIPENGEARPRKWSVVSSPFDNDHPTLAFIGQMGNTSGTLNVKTNERVSTSRFSHYIRSTDQRILGPQDLRRRRKLLQGYV
ncbi:hypothetical protein Tco_0546911 [Tanacetum coccineum]